MKFNSKKFFIVVLKMLFVSCDFLGFMIAHCTAAALVSENKTLSHPASVDSIPTR
jgi:hypothetical protein